MHYSGKALTRVLDSLHDGLYFVDKDRKIIYWNKAAELITGFTAEEVVGRSCSDNILTHVDCDGTSLCKSTICPLAATIKDHKPREATVYLHHKDGHRVPVSVRISTLVDENNEVVGGIELFTDVSNMEANELRVKELERLALLDNLTQLANRHYIERELTSRFEELTRYQVPFGFLLMDIDHFKGVNDTHGHDVGDDVLRRVAKTLTVNSRPFDLYGRWGGEEFIGIIKNTTDENLAIVANRIRMLVGASYVLLGAEEKLSVTISIGATQARPDDDMKTLTKRADNLLYQSKENGRNQVTIG